MKKRAACKVGGMENLYEILTGKASRSTSSPSTRSIGITERGISRAGWGGIYL